MPGTLTLSVLRTLLVLGGGFCLIMLPCDDYRLPWHDVAMPLGNMLSAGHVTVVANGGCRLLLRIVKFFPIMHFVIS